MSEWRIPLSDLEYGTAEEEAVLRVLRSRWLSMGAEVEAFEGEFAALVGTKHALAVANGTAAIHLAYQALGLKPGDEVIQPAINFVAAANITLAVGATPVFADIVGLEEPTIDPSEIARCISPRTKAVVVMHYGGYLSRMSAIVEICRRHGLLLIEDACHAVGARYLDPESRIPQPGMAGGLGDIACFSFFSNKNLAVGEGGMITTDNDALAARARLLRSHGMTTLTWDRHRGHADSYDVVEHGYNYRLDEIHAALGRVQLRKLPANNAARRQRVLEYRQRLSGLPGWTVPFAEYRGDSSCHLSVLVAPDQERRSRVLRALKDAKIQTSLHYPPVPGFKAFEPCLTDAVPRSVSYAGRAITLPLYPGMAAAAVEETCAVIRGNS